jgi:hypothetical protein
MSKITLNDYIGMLLLAWLPSTVIVFGLFVLTKREDCYMAISYGALLTVAIWAINLFFITRGKQCK